MLYAKVPDRNYFRWSLSTRREIILDWTKESKETWRVNKRKVKSRNYFSCLNYVKAKAADGNNFKKTERFFFRSYTRAWYLSASSSCLFHEEFWKLLSAIFSAKCTVRAQEWRKRNIILNWNKFHITVRFLWRSQFLEIARTRME